MIQQAKINKIQPETSHNREIGLKMLKGKLGSIIGGAKEKVATVVEGDGTSYSIKDMIDSAKETLPGAIKEIATTTMNGGDFESAVQEKLLSWKEGEKEKIMEKAFDSAKQATAEGPAHQDDPTESDASEKSNQSDK